MLHTSLLSVSPLNVPNTYTHKPTHTIPTHHPYNTPIYSHPSSSVFAAYPESFIYLACLHYVRSMNRVGTAVAVVNMAPYKGVICCWKKAQCL